MKTQYFENYQSRLKTEAILKSVLCGVGCGFGAAFLSGLIFWLTGFKAFWLLFVILAVAGGVSGVLLYFKRFIPTDVTNARRLDRLGLEERLITMVELEKEDSYMAKIQREDAKAALDALDKTQIKIKIPRAIVIFASCLAVLGIGMTTVNILSSLGLLKGGDEIIEGFIEEQTAVYVTLTYEIEEGGIIDGDEEQVIALDDEGFATGEIVTAVADEGYVFKEWSDGVKSPSRFDVIQDSIVYTAIFSPISDEEGEEKEGDGEGDQAGDAPGEQKGDGDQSDSAEEGKPNPDATTGGGASKPNNQIIDGKTFYREVLEYYQDLANGQIDADDSGLSEEEIELIKKYLGIV